MTPLAFALGFAGCGETDDAGGEGGTETETATEGSGTEPTDPSVSSSQSSVTTNGETMSTTASATGTTEGTTASTTDTEGTTSESDSDPDSSGTTTATSGSTGEGNMCAEITMIQDCFLAAGCTWDFQGGVGGGECIPDDGGGTAGDTCGLVPLEFCDQVPGCMVEGEECVPT